MYSTRQVIRMLAEANPEQEITEDRIRRALRRGEVATPPVFAGRLVWGQHEIAQLSAALDLRTPSALESDAKAVWP